MIELDMLQIVAIGVGTGFGSALGTEVAKSLVTTIKEKRKKV